MTTKVKKEAADLAVDEKEESLMRAYELMLAFSPELLEGSFKKKIKELEESLTKAGGKIVSSDTWGKQRLAYKIGPHTEGIYVVYNLELSPAFVGELNEHVRIDPEVIRYILITLPQGYTYTRYKEEAVVPQEPEEKKPRKRMTSFRAALPALRPEEVGVEKAEEKVPEAPKPEVKEVDEKALDKKLDEILSDEDLNL